MSRLGKETALSRSQMLGWINKTLSINETKIENLGSGVVYCMLVNRFYLGAIQQSKIVQFPRSYHEYRANLKRFQEAVAALKIKGIVFDVFKVAEMNYYDNWTLIGKLHKHLTSLQNENHLNEAESSREQWRHHSIPNTQTHLPILSQSVICATEGHPMTMNNQPALTPLRIRPDDNKARMESMATIEKIKCIVTEDAGDKTKVTQLKRLLGLQSQEQAEEDIELKDLLSDYKKKQQVIEVD